MYEKPVLTHTLRVAAAYDPYLFMQPNGNDGEVAVAGDNTVNIGVTKNPTTSVLEPTPLILSGIAQVKLGAGGGQQGGRMKSATGGTVVAVATTGTTVQNVCCMLLADGAENDVVPAVIRFEAWRPALA